MPPATPDALSIDEDVAPRSGLERGFRVGEQLPWKGIWFEVEHVSIDRIMLKPLGETWNHQKQRQDK